MSELSDAHPLGAKVVIEEDNTLTEYRNRAPRDACALALLELSAAVHARRYVKVEVMDTYSGLVIFSAVNLPPARYAQEEDDE